MKLLVLGVSDIFRRRVIPVLASAGVSSLDLCSASHIPCEAPAGIPTRTFSSYAEALVRSDAQAVYISTHNSLHSRLIQDALANGRHVAVDKPAFLSATETEAALDLARSRGLILAEATVWNEHPRAAAMKRLFERDGGPTRLSACFSFPPLPRGNFRMDKALGGGALLDLGPYAVSPGRFFFGCAPQEVTCHKLWTADAPGSDSVVETSFACLLTYPGGRSFTGVFGFDTGYANTLQALGPGLAVRMDRAFTPPPDQHLEIECNGSRGPERESFAPSDAFAIFFSRFFNAIRAGDGLDFAQALREDSQALAKLIASAGMTA
jgi:dTDP-3,4-didehydro-2,6-dideoxy-alpha-D-glucose 3-reductase